MEKPIKIIIVEDETIIALDVKNKLENLGYSVPAIVDTGEDAIIKAADIRPELILMDIRLKGKMDGIEAACRIREQFNIPIIYLTAYQEKLTLDRIKATEPYGHLLKPFEDRELRTVIDMALYRYDIEMKLKNNEQWLSTTLRSIGDGVIVTDERGRIKFMNPVAEALTGWGSSKAHHKHLWDIFKIINEYTGEPADDPVTQALTKGVVSGMDNHTVLITKEGNKIPITDSGSPIKDEKGLIRGAVLIFHDVTEQRKMRDRLQRALSDFRQIFNTSVPMCVISKEYTMLQINDTFAAYFQMEKDTTIGSVCSAIWQGPLCNTSQCPMRIILEGQKRYDYEVDKELPNGEKISCIVTAVPYLGPDGEIIGIIESFTDITARKKAEEKIRISEERYRELFNNMSSGVAVYEAVNDGDDFIFKDLNRASEHIDKINKSDLLGKSVVDVFPGVKDFGLFKVFQRVWRTGNSENHPISLYKDDRIAGWRENYVYKLPSGEVVAVYDDVTRRKQIEENLRISQERVQLAIEGTNQGLWDYNVATDELYFDPSWQRMLGFSKPHEIHGDYALWVKRIHPEDRQRVEDLFNSIRKGDTPYFEVEYRLKTIHKQWIWVLSRGKVIERNKNGAPLRIVCTNIDITFRKHTENQIKQSLKEKEVLLKEIHHRVKNNMQVISSMLNLHSQYIQNKEVEELFKDSQSRVRSMALVHEKLYESENLDKINFSHYSRDLLSYLFQTYKERSTSIQLTIDMKNIFLDINSAIPCGIIINELVSNSLKHAFPNRNKGEIYLTLYHGRDNNLILIVRDNGTGFSGEIDLNHPDSLGLVLVQCLTHQLNGKIELSCHKGTEFKITFPREKMNKH
ncbi:MAG: PAS domain S-box protein [bacterium]